MHCCIISLYRRCRCSYLSFVIVILLRIKRILLLQLHFIRDRSFRWNTEFWAEPRSLPASAEFVCFRGILRNLVLGQMQHILVKFRWPYCKYTWFRHEIHDCHSGSDGRNTEKVELSLSEILPVNLVDRLHLSVAVTGDKYCIFGWVQRPWKISYRVSKICRGEPRNLTNWPAEFGKICHGKLWSLHLIVYCTNGLYVGLSGNGLLDERIGLWLGVRYSPLVPCIIKWSPWSRLPLYCFAEILNTRAVFACVCSFFVVTISKYTIVIYSQYLFFVNYCECSSNTVKRLIEAGSLIQAGYPIEAGCHLMTD